MKKNISNNILDVKGEDDKSNICNRHNSKFEYYCVDCDNYYCSKCLLFYEEESKRHPNHLILQLEKMKYLKSKFKSEDNIKYINQIEDLKKQLTEEKEINNKLKAENKRLEKIINKKRENMDDNKRLEKEISNLKENMRQLENELNQKNKAIQNYILEINDLKENKNQITSIKPGEKIFSVLFIT